MRRTDVLIALAMVAFVEFEVFGSDVEPKASAAALGALCALALAARRWQPWGALGLSVPLAVLGLLEFEQSPQSVLLVVLFGAYSAGAHAEGPRAVSALAMIWLGWLVAETGDVIIQWPLSGGAWFLGRLLRSNRRQTERLRELTAELERERADHARLAIAEERARIARELHDIVAHSVSVMVVHAGGERLALGGERAQTREVLAEIESTGRQALTEMRRLVGMLRSADDEPELAPAPGLDALEALAEHLQRAGLEVRLRREGTPVDLSPGLEITAYRIVQEALTNTLKHAGPARASVLVRFGQNELQLEISDDGTGGGDASRNGHGLPGMRERAGLFGGRVEAGPGPGGGFLVRAWLPIS